MQGEGMGQRVVSSVAFLIVAVVGLVAAYYVTYPQVAGVIRAQSWQEVPCTILTHEVVERRSSRPGGLSSYTVAVTYSYVYEGRELVGNLYDMSHGWSAGRDRALEAAEAHPPETKTTCFVDPESPTSSVLDRSPGVFLLWGLMPLPFIVGGIGGLWAQLKGAGTKTSEPAGVSRALRAGHLGALAAHFEPETRDGAIARQPRRGLRSAVGRPGSPRPG